MTPSEYAQSLEISKNRAKNLDVIRKDIVSWINKFNDISAAQISYWLKEKYGELDFKDRTLRWYVKKLRKGYNLPKSIHNRQYAGVPEIPMRYQVQVDFGHIWEVC